MFLFLQSAAQRGALWVEAHTAVRMLDTAANQLVQSGGVGDGDGATPVWAMGLHGEGEVIGMADTGLDTGHCAFEEAAGQEAMGAGVVTMVRGVVKAEEAVGSLARRNK